MARLCWLRNLMGLSKSGKGDIMIAAPARLSLGWRRLMLAFRDKLVEVE